MLSPLEKLYDKALESNISIYKFHVSKTKKAACLHNDGYKAIALDKPRIESAAEEKVLLAEELGHYETGSIYLIEATYNTPLARANRENGEAKARRYATKETLAPAEIQKAIDSGCYNDYEIAEYCDVPIDFLRDAFKYYRQKCVLFS